LVKRINLSESKYVQSGELDVGSRHDDIITTSPLGSCVAVVAYDYENKIGGIAHVMLPNESPTGKNENKYAKNAINNLLNDMKNMASKKPNIEICLIGGANVLKKKDDIIVLSIINSVQNIINEKKIPIKASSLGGFQRRSATLNLETKIVYYTIGNSSQKILWEFTK